MHRWVLMFALIFHLLFCSLALPRITDLCLLESLHLVLQLIALRLDGLGAQTEILCNFCHKFTPTALPVFAHCHGVESVRAAFVFGGDRLEALLAPMADV